MGVLIRQAAAPVTTPADGGEIWFNSSTLKMLARMAAGFDISVFDDGWRNANRLINGGFDLAQRQTAGTLTTYSQTASRVYTADRWAVTNENASVQYQRTSTGTTPETNLQNLFYGTFSKITTTGKMFVSQVVETKSCADLRGLTVRLQVKLKASGAKTLRIFLLQLANAGTADSVPGFASGAPSGTFISAFGANTVNPTFGTNLSIISPTTGQADLATIRSSGLDCAVTTAWQRFGGTFLLPSDYRNLVVVIGTDSQFAAADTFSVSEAGLYQGPEIRDWVNPSTLKLFQDCQRYYCKSFALETAPAQNAGLSGSHRAAVTVAAAVATSWNGAPKVQFPVQTVGSGGGLVTFYNPSAANAFVRNVTLSTDATVTSASNINETGFHPICTGIAAWAVGNDSAVHWTYETEL